MPRRRKKRTHVKPNEEEEEKVPKSFVFRKGKTIRSVGELTKDMRLVMRPYTATNLKEKKSNSLKDFINVSGPLNVKNFLMFSQTQSGNVYMRITKSPQGPTLVFKVIKYCLTKNVKAIQRMPHSPANELNFPPLVVLNNFGSKDDHMVLMSKMIQGLFPPINIASVELSQCKRVLLFDYNKETEEIEFRHYLINIAPYGVNKSIKKIISNKNSSKIPNLASYEDIADFIQQQKGLTESDQEDAIKESTVQLTQNLINKQKNISQQNSVKLKELGPRLQLKLYKIQEGACEGETLYSLFKEDQPKNNNNNEEEEEGEEGESNEIGENKREVKVDSIKIQNNKKKKKKKK